MIFSLEKKVKKNDLVKRASNTFVGLFWRVPTRKSDFGYTRAITRSHITTKPNLVLSYYVYFALLSLFLGNPIQIGPIDNNKSPLSSPVLTKKLENTLDRIEDAFKSLPDRPRSASIGNMKKGFVLDKKLQRNFLKFAIFLELKIVTA